MEKDSRRLCRGHRIFHADFRKYTVQRDVYKRQDLDVADIQDGDEALFGYVDTLVVNEKGYENLEKRAGGDVCAWLYGKGVQRLIVTQAEKGCTVYCRDEETFSVDGLKVPVVDVTGAGDTFCSSFLYGLSLIHI